MLKKVLLKSCFIPEVSSLGYQVPQAGRAIFQEHRTQQGWGSTVIHGSKIFFLLKLNQTYKKSNSKLNLLKKI